MQKKLLRFLQTGRFTPLGGSKEIATDLRIICATNRDPLVELNEKRFREDLYYRVNVVPIKMPPLRDRGTDILDIARFFLKKFAKQDHKKFEAIKHNVELKLCHYSWPVMYANYKILFAILLYFIITLIYQWSIYQNHLIVLKQRQKHLISNT